MLVCFMKNKEQVGAGIYVEDGPGNIQQLRDKKLDTICFANSTNKLVGPPRADSWEDVYRLVHEIWQARKTA